VLVVEVDLHVGDIARVGGALQGNEFGDVAANGEDHLSVGDDQEEEDDAEEEEKDIAILGKEDEELLIVV
jgi:hypothetical protein